MSPGGELPFGLEIVRGEDGYAATMVNGEERAQFSSVTLDGHLAVLEIEWYDSTITAELDESGSEMSGSWQRTSAGESGARLPFVATRGST